MVVKWETFMFESTGKNAGTPLLGISYKSALDFYGTKNVFQETK